MAQLAPWRIKMVRCIISVLAMGVGGLLAWAGWFHQMEDHRKIAAWTKVPCTILRWDMEVSETVWGPNPVRYCQYRYEYRGKTYTGHNYDEATDWPVDLRDFEKEGAAARQGPAFCYVDPERPTEASFRGPRMWFPWSLAGGGLLLCAAGFIFFILTFIPRRPLPPEVADLRIRRRALCLIGLGLMTAAIIVAGKQDLWAAVEGQLMRSKLVPIPAKIEATGLSEARGTGKNRNITYNMMSVVYSYEHGGRTWHADRWHHHEVHRIGGSKEDAKETLSQYPRGKEVTAWVHPQRPWIGTLDKGLSWSLAWAVMPLTLFFGGLHAFRAGWKLKR
ncbi:DUF3592 domain-containing protein [Luteolibacter sp. SL250]|uniref:DUF3592 domain-containing protein n=1 Tax=Luteolibacter sp. SL250 TaxID=2995170 RepID=UPI00226F0859|nr:DUF3592 domain-containing protein [Luteolibacter sp. SL250]WAC18429.1 DUF3592 domain-containing protein [Luteolibacter sp. SL250]